MSEKKFEHIVYEKRNSSAWIILNRPEKLNALHSITWREISEALDLAENDDEVRVVVLTGKGRAFCAGDDISELSQLLSPSDAIKYFSKMGETILKILRFSKPIIAAVNGLAYGGGCEIVELCDLAIASENARFCQPEGLIGAWPPLHAVIAPLIMGRKKAAEMMYTAEPIDAKEAEKVGLINKVVPPEKLEEAVMEMVSKIRRVAPLGITTMRKTLYRQFRIDDIETAARESIVLAQTEDFKEGAKAFLEKRPAQWKGR